MYTCVHMSVCEYIYVMLTVKLLTLILSERGISIYCLNFNLPGA